MLQLLNNTMQPLIMELYTIQNKLYTTLNVNSRFLLVHVSNLNDTPI